MIRINFRLLTVVFCFALFGINICAFGSKVHDSIVWGNLNKAKSLLESYPGLINSEDGSGQRPLDVAMFYNKKDFAEFLVGKGAQLNIFSAAWLGRLEKTNELIKANPELAKAKDIQGRTPLHWSRSEDVAKVLLANGTSINAKDKKGWTALQVIANSKYKQLAKFLISKGAEVDAFSACSLGMCEKLEEILNDDPSYIDKTKESFTLLHVATDKKTAEFLISRGANLYAMNEYGQTPIHVAASRGYRDVVELLVAKGVAINANDMYGRTPLHFAVTVGSYDMTKMLIDKGANLNARANRRDIGNSVLHKAAEKGNIEVVTLLIDSGAKVNAKNGMDETPLFYAKNKEVAELLIAKGCDVNYKSSCSGWIPLHEAANREVAEVLVAKGASLEVKDGMGRTPLSMAIERGKSDVIEFLISKDTSGKYKGRSHIYKNKKESDLNIWEASSLGLVEKVKSLLKDNPRLVNDKYSMETALYYADSKEIAEILISNGADVNAKDHSNRTALGRAAGCGYTEIVKLLISKGANVNSKNGANNTPLHEAASNGQLEVVKILIENGAEINARNLDRRTPLLLAVEVGYIPVAKLLVAKGADTSELSLIDASRVGLNR